MCSSVVRARLDSNSFLSFHVIGGPTLGLGSFSKYSAKSNSLGKHLKGGNLNMNVELIFKRKFTIGLSLTNGIYRVKNEFIGTEVERRRKDLTPERGASNFTMQLNCFYVNTSFLFQIKKFIIQPKFNIGFCDIVYNYQHSYNPTPLIPGSPSVYSYSASEEQKIRFSLSPELHLKYLLARKSRGDIALNLGVGYVLALAKIDILEERITYNSFTPTRSEYHFITLKNPVQTLHASLGIAWFIKKSKKK